MKTHIAICKMHMKAYLILQYNTLMLQYNKFAISPVFVDSLNLSFCFSKMAAPCYFKTCHMTFLWKVCLNLFRLVAGHKIEQQQPSFKFSLKLPRQQKNATAIFLCTISGTRYKKKTRSRVQKEDAKLRFSKNLFFRFKSKYLCYISQNKIIKTPVLKITKFHVDEASKNCAVQLDSSIKIFAFHHLIFQR